MILSYPVNNLNKWTNYKNHSLAILESKLLISQVIETRFHLVPQYPNDYTLNLYDEFYIRADPNRVRLSR